MVLQELFQARIAKPLGLTNTEIVHWVASEELLARTARPHVDGQLVLVKTSDQDGAFGAAYGVHSEAIDYANWMIALMRGDGLSKTSTNEFFRLQGEPKSKLKQWLAKFGLAHESRSLGFSIHPTSDGQLHGHDGNNPGYTNSH